jgi:hypothetical protein
MKYRNAKYNEIGTIDCEIEHPEYGWIPFTASPDDCEEYGRGIFDQTKESATPYDFESEEHLEKLKSRARGQRDSLLLELDQIVMNPLRFNALTEDEKQALAAYRQALLDVPQQPGFPKEINWPEKDENVSKN